MKIALVHDYLREFGGAERVLIALHELFPDAPVYTAFVDQASLGKHWSHFEGWEIHETWLSKVPFIKKIFSPLRILAGKAFTDLDLSEFDVVISSSNAYMAKAIKVPNGKHFCYCHTPPRSLYGYTTMSDWKKNPLTRWGGALINHYMRVADYYAAQGVDHFIANSQETARRIKKFYRRDSVVINPPVAVPSKPPATKQARDYYLYVNRLALAKHPELAVAVCSQLNVPLKVVGTGPLAGGLHDSAGPTIEFLGAVSDAELAHLYAGAKALLYPVEDEDFGIVPVEAMGYGVPVIAHNSGGPLETIVDGKTGVLFDELTVCGVTAAVERFEKQQASFQAQAIYKQAQNFSLKKFQNEILNLVNNR
jgi:glycosyltransferase involved in cell wall biosynthesis